MTPEPSWTHQAIAGTLMKRIDNYARAEGIGFALAGPADVETDKHTLIQPDLFVVPVVAGRLPRDFVEAGRLLLAIEVLSPWSVRRDRFKKRDLYARMNAEYWIVDHDARSMERFIPGTTTGQLCLDRLVWQPTGAEHALAIDLPEFFTEALNR